MTCIFDTQWTRLWSVFQLTVGLRYATEYGTERLSATKSTVCTCSWIDHSWLCICTRLLCISAACWHDSLDKSQVLGGVWLWSQTDGTVEESHAGGSVAVYVDTSIYRNVLVVTFMGRASNMSKFVRVKSTYPVVLSYHVSMVSTSLWRSNRPSHPIVVAETCTRTCMVICTCTYMCSTFRLASCN